MTNLLTFSIRASLIALIWMPLIVSFETMYPHVVGKALYSRAIIEIIFGLWIILAIKEPRYRPKKSWILVALLIYLSIGFLSGIAGVNFSHSMWSDYNRMGGLWDQLHWFTLIIILSGFLRSRDSWKPFFNWTLATGTAIGILALLEAFNLSPAPDLYANCTLDATLGNASYLSQLILVNIFIAAGLLGESFFSQVNLRNNEENNVQGKRSRKKKKGKSNPLTAKSEDIAWLAVIQLERFFYVISLIVYLWVFFLAASRGGLLGLLIGTLLAVVLFLLFNKGNTLKPILITSGGLLGITILFFSFDAVVGLPVESYCRVPSNIEGVLDCDEFEGVPVVGSCSHSLPEPYIEVLKRTLIIGNDTEELPKSEDLTTDYQNSEPHSLLEKILGMRAQFLDMAIKGVYEKPLLGWGPENFSRVFDKYSTPSYYEYGFIVSDNAHNKPINELAERGILGFCAYIFLWFSLLWRLIVNIKPRESNILASMVLSALIGYMIQSIFLFDTPAGLLQWSLLASWVISGDEKSTIKLPPILVNLKQKITTKQMVLVKLTGQKLFINVVSILVVITILTSLHLTGYKQYKGAESYKLARQLTDLTIDERIRLATFSHNSFPGISGITRQDFLEHFAPLWHTFNIEEQNQVAQFIYGETQWVIDNASDNSRLIQAAYAIPQILANGEQLEQLEDVLDVMVELAPNRATTHLFLGNQELLKGNFDEAIKISEDFISIAPNMRRLFDPLIEQAVKMKQESITNLK